MSPAEAAIREAMSDLTAGTLHADFLAQACNPTAIHSLLSELDALRAETERLRAIARDAAEAATQHQADVLRLRARCKAADALLREAMSVIDLSPEYPRGAYTADKIDAHLKGAGRE